MPRGTKLSIIEQGKALTLHIEGYSLLAIARQSKNNRTVLRNFLQSPKQYRQKKRSGRKPVLPPSAKRCLLREAHKGEMTANELRKRLDLPMKVSRIRQILSQQPTLEWRPMVRAPSMTENPKKGGYSGAWNVLGGVGRNGVRFSLLTRKI